MNPSGLFLRDKRHAIVAKLEKQGTGRKEIVSVATKQSGRRELHRGCGPRTVLLGPQNKHGFFVSSSALVSGRPGSWSRPEI